jgi:hypothetical protein
LAVALQLNYQIEQGLDPFVISKESSNQQGEMREYRSGAVHPQAQAIIDALEVTIGTDPTGVSRDTVQLFADIPGVRSVRNPTSTRNG